MVTAPGLFVVDLRTLHSAEVCCCKTGGGLGDLGTAAGEAGPEKVIEEFS